MFASPYASPLRNHALVKQINRCGVLNALRLCGRASRAQLAERLGLDRKSLTNLVADLQGSGWVEEAGRQTGSAGRPHELLRLAPSRLAVGVDLEPDHVVGLVCSADGAIQRRARSTFPFLAPWPTIAQALSRVYAQLTANGPRPCGTGLVTPAVIDQQGQSIEESANLPTLVGTSSQDFADLLGTPVLLQNASAATALAEKWYGEGQRHQDFISVNLGIGVGAGLILNRRLHQGAGQVAGELGHVMIEPGGRPCRCGNRGCLEAYLGARAVLERLAAAAGTPLASLDELEAPHAALSDEFARLGHALGVGLATVINLLSPTAIFLHGQLTTHWPHMEGAVAQGIAEHTVSANARRAVVAPSTLKDGPALGAACLVWAPHFEVEGHFLV